MKKANEHMTPEECGRAFIAAVVAAVALTLFCFAG